MKILLKLSLILSIIIIPIYKADAANTSITDVVTTFFNSLKIGDVEMIKKNIDGDLYQSTKVLLEQNEHYSDFLIQTYENSQLHILNVFNKRIKTTVDISVNFPKAGIKKFRLTLKKSDGRWKIVQQIEL